MPTGSGDIVVSLYEEELEISLDAGKASVE